MKIKYLALIAIVWALCTHCTDERISAASDILEDTPTHSTVAQHKMRLSPVPHKKQGAQKANVDPETGQLVSPTEHHAPATNETNESSALNHPVEKMEEKESPVPGGGMMIDLKGRFKSPIRATIKQSGQTEIGHHDDDKVE